MAGRAPLVFAGMTSKRWPLAAPSVVAMLFLLGLPSDLWCGATRPTSSIFGKGTRPSCEGQCAYRRSNSRGARDTGPRGPDPAYMRGPAWEDEDEGSFTIDQIGEPTPKVLQAWMNDPCVREIVDVFQPTDMKGKDSMQMRDIYKMLEIMGLNRPEFIEVMMASNEDEEEEEERFFDMDEYVDDSMEDEINIGRGYLGRDMERNPLDGGRDSYHGGRSGVRGDFRDGRDDFERPDVSGGQGRLGGRPGGDRRGYRGAGYRSRSSSGRSGSTGNPFEQYEAP